MTGLTKWYRCSKRAFCLLVAILLVFTGSFGVFHGFAEETATGAAQDGDTTPPEATTGGAKIDMKALQMRAFAVQADSGQTGVGRLVDVKDKIDLTGMYVKFNGQEVYNLESGTIADVKLIPASTMIFDLAWAVKAANQEYSFQAGDYFTIPIVKVDGLQLKRTYESELTAALSDGGTAIQKKIATGAFEYDEKTKLLTYTVTFTDEAKQYIVQSGTANGDASLTATGAELPISFNGGSENKFTVVQREITVPGLPDYTVTMEEMNKKVVSPATGANGQLEMSTLVSPVPSRGTGSTYGVDWRMSFLDLARTFESGKKLGDGEYVIIEDIVSKNQAFSNFNQLTQPWASGFTNSSGAAAGEPFFLEIPVAAYGEGRIINKTGQGTAGTVIKGSKFKKITSPGDAASITDQVKKTALSWGIETLSDGREKLIINAGRMGPDVTGSGLTAGLLDGTQRPGAIVNLLVDEILGARQAIVNLEAEATPNSADIAKWKKVLDNDIRTLLFYWPGFAPAIQTGVGAASANADDIVAAAEKKSVAELITVLEGLSGEDAIVDTMPINAFVLHYRTILKDTENQDLSNSGSITCTLATKTDEANYKHQFGDSINATLKQGVAFVKAERLDDKVADGEVNKDAFDQILGIPGVKFEVYEAENSAIKGSALKFTSDKSVYTLSVNESGETALVTGADGKLQIAELTSGKSYILKEIEGPAGYYAEQKEFLFTVGDSGVYYAVYNTPRMVQIHKKDESDRYLAGAVFSVHKSDKTQLKGFTDKGDHYWYESGKGSDTVTTPTDKPLVIRGLPDGSYYFEEVSAPAGYQLVDSTYPFTLDISLPAASLWIKDAGSVVNRPIQAPTIQILKKSADGSSEAPMEKVTFSLQGKTNGYKGVGVTGKDGVIKFSDLPANDFSGSYTLTETTPAGYKGISPIAFVVEADGRIKNAPTVNAADKYLVSSSWNPEAYTLALEIRNEKIKTTTPGSVSHELKIYKVDGDTSARLPNAQFRLTGPTGAQQTVTTASPSGVALFTLSSGSPAGQYSLSETAAPNGYQHVSDIRFSIDENGKITLNRSYGYVTVVDDGISLLVENVQIRATTAADSGARYGAAGYTGRDRDQSSSLVSSRGTQDITDTNVPLGQDKGKAIAISDNPVPFSPATGDSALPRIIACGLALFSAIAGIAAYRRKR